jgi:hypothetical protein
VVVFEVAEDVADLTKGELVGGGHGRHAERLRLAIEGDGVDGPAPLGGGCGHGGREVAAAAEEAEDLVIHHRTL